MRGLAQAVLSQVGTAHKSAVITAPVKVYTYADAATAYAKEIQQLVGAK